MLQKKNIVVFDFDGTLSASDSNYEFYKYCFKHSARPWLFLPLEAFCVFGVVLNFKGVWWREVARNFLTPKMVCNFSKKVIKEHKQKRFGWAKEQVKKEKQAGNMVVLVSAGPDYLIPSLVSDMKFDAIICSKMDTKKPYKYEFICWGKNKVIAFDKWAKENKIIPNVIRSYSDSMSDMPMMNIAKEHVWINRKTGLRCTKKDIK